MLGRHKISTIFWPLCHVLLMNSNDFRHCFVCLYVAFRWALSLNKAYKSIAMMLLYVITLSDGDFILNATPLNIESEKHFKSSTRAYSFSVIF